MEEEKAENHRGTEAQREKEENSNIAPFSFLCASVPLWFKSLPAKADALAVGAGAFKEGVVNHLDIWKEALKADRARPKQSPLTRAELAFLPAALEVSESPASPAARMIALALAGFFTVAVAWASIGELDIVATAAGKIIPSERVKLIQPLETSIVRRVAVIEGQEVKAGDLLVELEAAGAQTDVDRLMADLDSTRADMARLDALQSESPITAFAAPRELAPHLVDLQRSLLATQWREHQANLARLESDLAEKQAGLKTTETEIRRHEQVAVKIKDETDRRRELAEKGYGSQIARLTAEKELAENHGQQQVQKARLVETRAGIQALKSQATRAREEFRRDATAKLAEARAKAAASEQELIKAMDRERVQSLTAPVDGTVQQIKIHTIGGVVQPAQELMVVIPKGAVLEIEAKLPNKDIAFVEPGQEASIKIDAFPFTRYGTLDGRVETVSLDAIQDEDSQSKDYVFPIRLSLSDSVITVENGKRIPLTPGMTVIAEVKTGTRKPIEYVLAPLKKYGMETGRER